MSLMRNLKKSKTTTRSNPEPSWVDWFGWFELMISFATETENLAMTLDKQTQRGRCSDRPRFAIWAAE